jgi:hypothetical protein
MSQCLFLPIPTGSATDGVVYFGRSSPEVRMAFVCVQYVGVRVWGTRV